MGVSGNLCSFLNKVKPLVLYYVEHGITMEPMKGQWASSRVDLGYTELFCIPEVTSVVLLVLSQWSWGLSGVPSGTLRLLTCFIGTRNFSAPKEWHSGLISLQGGYLMGFLELQQEPGEYSRVTAGMDIRNSTLFSEVRTPL